MNITTKLVSVLCIVTLGNLAAVGHAKEKAVATVNGVQISQQQFDGFVEVLKGKNPKFEVNDKSRPVIIDELVTREIMFQEAKKQKLDQNPRIKYLLEQQKVELMMQALIQKQLTENPVSDKEMKKIYDQQVAGSNQQEYKARHILLKTESEAKAMIAKLDAGKDFAQLAKEHSTGPSAKDGGDLGWFSPNRMVPPFARAVVEMKKGSYSKQPVKTDFGWHVIKLEDTRKLEPPKFDAVKKQIASALNKQRIQEYLIDLRSKSKISVK